MIIDFIIVLKYFDSNNYYLIQKFNLNFNITIILFNHLILI